MRFGIYLVLSNTYVCILNVLELSFQKKSGKRAYKCKYCNTTTNTSKEIKDHFSSVHEGKKTHSCEICHKQFGYLKNKRRHITSVHERKKSYSCESCHKQFGLLSNKKRHQELGKCPINLEKFYSCEICQKKFGYLSNKNRHQKSGMCSGKPKVKPMKEVIEDIKNIQPVVEMNSIKIPKKVNAYADNLCNLDYDFVFL